MQTSFTLDYVSGTTKDMSISQVMLRFCFGMEMDEWITGKAHNGYEHALRHPYGHYIQWTTKREDMGINVNFTGMPLKEIHDAGHNTLEIVFWMHENEFRFSRIDLAIDVRGVKFVLDELQRVPRTGSVNKKPILIKDGADNEEGSTLYVGSWESDKFIRIYDKGVLQIPLEENWFRFELETKGKTASKIARMIHNMSDAQVGKFAQGVMKAMFNAEHEDYQKVIDSDPVKVSSTKDINHNTYDWLMSSVSKTLARVILELPHRDVMTSFEKEVNKHIREIAAQSLTKTPKP